MTALSIDNRLFVTYMIAGAIMILKLMEHGWVTVYRVLKVGGGWATPEDLKPGLINGNPRSEQLDLNDYVDRSRRINRAMPLAVSLFAVLATTSPVIGQEKIFVIRHAEKEATGSDPSLTDAGRERARDWAKLLSNAGIKIVINTNATRSRETGEIISQALAAKRAEVPISNLAALMDLMTFDYSEETILVVAHTETIPSILREMGVSDAINVTEEDYANLFFVAKSDGHTATFIHLRMP